MIMKILENLKLDTWWGVVLYLGVLLIAASFFFKVDFLEEKHLFGLGLGMVLVGIAHWIALRHVSTFKPPNFYTGGAALLQWREIRHNFLSILILIIGLGLILLFGFQIIKNLI